MSTSAPSSAAVRAIPRHPSRRRPGVALIAAALVAACAVGPDFVRPAPPSTTGYVPGAPPSATVAGDGHAQRFAAGAAVPADWWKRFGSPGLDATVAEALARSPTLASANATLRQSEDERRAGYGVFFPQIGADLGATRERVSPLRFGQGGPSSIFNLFTLSGSVSYLVDLFGGERRQLEALGAGIDVQRSAVLATYLTLTSNVVNASVARAAYRAEVDATRAIVESAAERVELAKAQYTAGTVPYASVLSLEADLASLRASLPPLELKAEQAGHLLSVLAGHAPSEWTAPETRLGDFVLPEDLPLTLPSALVRQRPDVLGAEAQVHRASAAIGVATANLLPQLTLSGSLGNEAAVWSELRNPSGRIWSGGADLGVPVFQGGQAWYTRKAAIDAYEAARANYQQAVLAAFQQVADALRALEHDAESVRDQAESLEASRTALALTDANYRAGTADYLAVLVATRQYHAAEVGYLASVAQRLQDTVALYAALGGGWSTGEEHRAAAPSPPASSRSR